MLTDLVLAGERIVGVEVLRPDGVREVVLGDAVVLATGGAGQLYSHTTNPAVATGDGLAAALRAGVATSDLEFYQFHPTTLAAPGNFLISEAVRGEGAVLRNAAGERFMLAAHPDAELAPRDVVARAIAAEMARQGGEPVVLDARGIDRETLARRFPTIIAACSAAGYDLASEPVPVTPAAHYYMGGITTDLDGRTSLPGLFAVGEVACTGVHGANRLASNSLLEGAVFARRVAAALGGLTDRDGLAQPDGLTELNGLSLTKASTLRQAQGVKTGDQGPTLRQAQGVKTGDQGPTLRQAQGVKTGDQGPALRQAQGVKNDHRDTALRQAQGVNDGGARRIAIQTLMWEHAGLTRSGAGLALAAARLREWGEASATRPDTRERVETANLLTVAQALVAAAETRRESRGAHARSDFPQTEPIATRDAGRQLQTQGH
jgi:L-aspartate oxidase